MWLKVEKFEKNAWFCVGVDRFRWGYATKSNEQSITCKCQNLLKHAFFYDAYAKSREVFLDFKDAILFRIQFCACLAEEDTYPVTVRCYGRLKMCPASSGHCDSSWQNSFPWFNPIVLSRPSCWCFLLDLLSKNETKKLFVYKCKFYCLSTPWQLGLLRAKNSVSKNVTKRIEKM